MARSQNPNSANSQFFIMFDDGHFLNGQYTVWGRVTQGMEHVDAIIRGEPPSRARPHGRGPRGGRRMIRRTFLALAAAAGLAGAAWAQDAGDVLVIDVAGAHPGTVEIELLPEVAPKHVERIEALARAGAYDGVAFHRVIDGFMAQTGDVRVRHPRGLRPGQGRHRRLGPAGPAGGILEPAVREGHRRHGALGGPELGQQPVLHHVRPGAAPDGQYTVVGKVIAGQDVVDAIRRGDGANGEVSDRTGWRR